jgi:hypothetical protein
VGILVHGEGKKEHRYLDEDIFEVHGFTPGLRKGLDFRNSLGQGYLV